LFTASFFKNALAVDSSPDGVLSPAALDVPEVGAQGRRRE
jgi:hypothetical protein